MPKRDSGKKIISSNLMLAEEKFTTMKADDFSKTDMNELKEILRKEGNQKTQQFKEWWDVFEILSYGRKLKLSELEMHSILSNKFELKRK